MRKVFNSLTDMLSMRYEIYSNWWCKVGRVSAFGRVNYLVWLYEDR